MSAFDSAGKPATIPTSFPFLGPPAGPGELGTLGDYRIRKVIGVGGMGYVFEAEDTILHRTIALKVLRPDLASDAEHRERFLREARAAAGLTSDYVIPVLLVGQAEGLPFIVMPLLFGETLQARIERRPPLTLWTALMVIREAAAGLVAAHARGMIHRDVKPANIWLETDGPGGAFRRARILDFGLVRRLQGETSLTSTGFIVGTPNYMAPEQAAGTEIDRRADLFGLGCVAYTVLTGELPFPGNSAMAVMMALASKTPAPVSAKNPVVPPAASDLVNRLLAKDPANRPHSADEVIAVLDEVMRNLTAVAAAAPASPTTVTQSPDTMGSIEVETWPSSHSNPPPAAHPSFPGTTPAPPSYPAVTPAPPASTTTAPLPTNIITPAHASAQIPLPPAPPRGSRWSLVAAGLGLSAAVALATVYLTGGFRGPAPAPPPPADPIIVGILHSASGTMAVSEAPVIDATLLAIDELNQAGGVLGRPVKAVVVDCKSDADVFAREAERLVIQEKVAALFGCWTSASRKAVRPVVERQKNILFYPVQYEGLEESPRIVYLGPTPNQQLVPAVEFLVKQGKRRLYLIGSDYVFPRTASAIIKDKVKDIPGLEVAGETFIPFGSTDVSAAVVDIRLADPDAVVNTVNGSTNFYFYRELRKEGVTSATLPTLSVSISENEVRGLDPVAMAGDYLAASYFQTVGTAEGREFVRKVREKYGHERVTSDAMAAAYTGVHLWAKAAAKAGAADADSVLNAVRGLEFAGPGGVVRVDPQTLHTWQRWQIGTVRSDGLVDVVASSPENVRPYPYLGTRTRAEWEQFLNALYLGWHGRWIAPGP